MSNPSIPAIAMVMGLAASGLPASAAGPGPVVVEPAVAAPAPARPTNWAGPYVGLSFGAALNDGAAELGDYSGAIIDSDIEKGLFPDEIDESETGFTAGVALGYNVQRDSFVGGIELDAAFLGHDAEANFSKVDPSGILAGVTTDSTYRTDISSLATLRLRGGFAQGRNLFYATGGVAGAHVENEFVLELPELGYTSPDWSSSDTLFGYALGLGVERQVTGRARLKAEILYYDLEDVTVEGRDPDVFPGEAIDYRFRNDGWIARIGLNVRF